MNMSLNLSFVVNATENNRCVLNLENIISEILILVT